MPFRAILAGMTRPSICGFALLLGLAAPCVSQPQQDAARPQLKIVQLPPANYPPDALAAGVFGEVVLSVVLLPDGALDSVASLNGPPMLRSAAEAAARGMRFSCLGCREAKTQFELRFQFKLGPARDCVPNRAPVLPSVTDEAGAVVLTDQPAGTCDQAGSVGSIRTRSLRCLYLWRCGWRKFPGD